MVPFQIPPPLNTQKTSAVGGIRMSGWYFRPVLVFGCSFFFFFCSCDWPRPTQGLPGPSGPEPRKSPKRVRKEYAGPGPQKS